jgi:serine/threonine-protein kinase
VSVAKRYVRGPQIGAGGMATVHVGRALPGEGEGQGGGDGAAQTVAIKRLHPWLAREPGIVASLLDEGRVVAQVVHPNVVRLLDVVVEDKDCFLVFEYVPGESLGAISRALPSSSSARIPVAIACAIACDVLRGLHAAHDATDERGRPLGIVHRDVSPHNVLVGADGVARLLDFGVAKAAGRMQTTTRAGTVKGKMAYMAPEQLRGGLATRRSDVYAAAIVLWEMLAGRRLFGEVRDAGDTLERMARPLRPPSAFVSGLPPALDRVVLRALSYDPRERQATAADMAADVSTAIAAAPPAEIAAWLVGLVGDRLAERARLVEREERGESADPLPAGPAGEAPPGDGALSRLASVVRTWLRG